MKKILVCGGTGFMGKNIVERLQKTSHIFSVSKHGQNPIDLTNSSEVEYLFKSIKPDIVVQAAAVTSGAKDSVERPYIHVTDNAIMNSILLRASFEHNVKHFVFLSCGVMYQPGDIPRKESEYNEHDRIFKDYFGIGWTKVYIEKMMEFYSSLGRTRYTAIRHSNTYGPHDKYHTEYSHVFCSTIRKVLKANDEILVWGNGTETARDLIYVTDVVDFIELILEKQIKPYELINISSGKAITVKEMVEKIMLAAGKDLKIKYDSTKPVIPTRLSLDNSYAYKEYGWFPKVSIEDGIQKTIEWVKNNIGLENVPK